ncbi:MAG TPA: hydroxylamine reductase, partial [Clostridia bacterium]|nr:hydroxylamine reductase [Clostridia bacterium]
MFCYQCQETAGSLGCTVKGVCGKDEPTSNLQDLLIHTLKGIGVIHSKGNLSEADEMEAGRFTVEALFATITNANFDEDRISKLIDTALRLRDSLAERAGISSIDLGDAAVWQGVDKNEYLSKAPAVGVLSTENEDIRSLRELTIYGLKGMAAYTDH